MKVLVIGAAGFIGYMLAPDSLARGHEMVCLDNMMYGIPTLLTSFIHNGFNFVKGDVRNTELVKYVGFQCFSPQEVTTSATKDLSNLEGFADAMGKLMTSWGIYEHIARTG